MSKKISIKLCFIIFILFPTLLFANRNIGEVEQKNIQNNELRDIPIDQWVGNKFIILEKSPSSQKFDYEFRLSKDKYGLCDPNEFQTVICRLKYDKFAGKTITAIDIDNHIMGSIITFIVEDTRKIIYATSYDGQVRDITLLDDILKAKERWLGKTIYSKKRFIETYNENLDKYGKVKIKIGEPLKVIDILWGYSSYDPLWIVVETSNNKKGFLSSRYSWTNVYKSWWTSEQPWEYDFFEENPKQIYNWDKEIWKLIENHKVRIGMNKEQVKLSWGKPQKINKDIYADSIHEQWIYNNQYLYLENDILTAIQNN